MDDKNFGVITEQGYPVGQFGFTSLTESEKENIKKDEENKKKEKENEKNV